MKSETNPKHKRLNLGAGEFLPAAHLLLVRLTEPRSQKCRETSHLYTRGTRSRSAGFQALATWVLPPDATGVFPVSTTLMPVTTTSAVRGYRSRASSTSLRVSNTTSP